jgi:hypothetical protein
VLADDATVVALVRRSWHGGAAETRVFMSVLYEDVLARIKALGEGDDPKR